MQLPHLEDGLERCFQPWEKQPLQLVSWFDMLNFSARAFLYCGRALGDIREDAIMLAACDLDGGEAGFLLTADIDDAVRRSAIKHLESIEPQFSAVGLALAAETVSELIADLKKDIRHNVQWLLGQIQAIAKIADKELKNKAFFYIPPERMKFWPTQKKPFAFGNAVADSFPSSTFDVNSAAHCLAISLSTAAVFHLMRVLEIGLSAMGGVFGVSLAHTNWAPAIDQIQSKVRDMHKDDEWKAGADCKDQQEFYSQAVSQFVIFKDAWRNHTMHVRGKYTQDEAENIFENVKVFMQKLAEKLDEDIIPTPPA